MTAGCSGLGGSSTEATPNQQSGQATPIPPATAVPVATEEPGSELNEPTTSAADDGANPYVGAVSEDAILSNHRETLSEAGSYSFTQNISIDNQQGGTELDEVWSVGTDTGETLVETEMRAGTTTSYTTEDGTTYSREQRDGETYYGVTATPENNVGLGGLSELNYTHRTEQVDGKTLHIYTSDDAESVPTGEQAGAEVTINDFNYRLEVFEGGHIKRLSIEFQATVTRDGSTQEVYSLTERRYFGIGNTTVEEPDWIEQAR